MHSSAPTPEMKRNFDKINRKLNSAPPNLNLHTLLYGSRADNAEIDLLQTAVRTYNFKSVQANNLGELHAQANSPEHQIEEEIKSRLLDALEEGLEPLMHYIDDTIAETPEGIPRVWKLNTIIYYLGERETLQKILRKCLKPDNIEEIGRFSYFHANGFDKYVLAAFSGWKLRLHIWWSEERLAFEENVHNHRWFFASNIITGTLHQNMCEEIPFAETQDENFDEKDTESRIKYINNPIRENTDHHTMDNGTIVTVKIKERTSFTAPCTYVFPMNLFHQVVDQLGGDAAMTLVLTAPSEENTSILMAPILDDEFFEETTKLVKRIEVVDIIRRFNRVISFLRGETLNLTLY